MMVVETPVLTNQEAVEFLRLDTDFDEPGDSIRALHRLVRQGKLRPLRCGRSYKFTLSPNLLRWFPPGNPPSLSIR